MQTLVNIDDPRLVKAFAHPLRVGILHALESGIASPTELAEHLGASIGRVSYHVRQLAQLGFIELVKTAPRRGALEHYYRAKARPRITDEAWSKAPGIVKEALVESVLGQVGEQANTAAMEGGFGAEGAHLTRMPLLLDREGWRRVSQELDGTLERIEKISRESAERLRAPHHEQEERATVVMMLFELAEEPVREPLQRRGRGARNAPARLASGEVR